MAVNVAPAHVANHAPRWVVVLYGLGVIPPLLMAGTMLGGLSSPAGDRLNGLVNLMLAGGAVAALSVQVSALAGLLAHRHWAREVALLAQAFWAIAALAFVIPGINGAGFGFFMVAVAILALGFFATRTLWRGWDLGQAPVYEAAIHPHGWVTWSSVLGALLILPYVGFVVWVLYYVHGVVPDVSWGTLATIGSLMILITLPWFVVHAVAAYGLDHRHDYGLVLAIIGGVLWFFTIVGIPVGLAQLLTVWKVAHPVLALPSRLPGSGAAQA